jgi:hypothetical protein
MGRCMGWRKTINPFFFVIIIIPLEFVSITDLFIINHLEWVIYFQSPNRQRPETTSDAIDDTQQF